MVIHTLSRTRQQGEFMEKKILDFWLWIQLTNPPLWNIPTGTHTVCHSLSHTLTYISPLSHTDTQQPPSGVWKVYSLFVNLQRRCFVTAAAGILSSVISSFSLQHSFFYLFILPISHLFFLLSASLFLTFLVIRVIPSIRRCESNSSLLSFTRLKKTVCVCLTLLTRTDHRTSDMSNRRCPPPDIWCLI